MRIEACAGVFADEPAVAQYGDAIADLVHLVEEVRDEQDRDALVTQLADQCKQRRDFIGVETRGRFVEDQHACVGRDGACDGGELLQRRGQAAGELFDVDVEPESGEQLARAPVRLAPVDAAAAQPGQAWIPAGADVLRDGEIRQQVAFLVHGADAEVLGMQWRGRVHRLAE